VKYMSENIDDIETLPTHLIQRSTWYKTEDIVIFIYSEMKDSRRFTKMKEMNVSNPPTKLRTFRNYLLGIFLLSNH